MDDVTRPNGIRENTNSTSAPSNSADDTIILADYLRVISKHRRMIFWICVIVVITTAVISLFLPKSFAATASIVPPIDAVQKELELAGRLGVNKSSIVSKALGVTSIAQMYTGILRSRVVTDAIIEKFNLSEVYKQKKYVSKVREILKKRARFTVGDEGIVLITVEDRNPKRAAEMANAFVDELDRQNKRLSTGQAASKKVFLENRLKEIEQDLSKIDNLLSRDAKIKEMLFELLTRECEIAKIEEAKSMPTIQVLDRAVVPERKYRPQRAQMVLVAGTTGLLISILAAIIRERLVRLSKSRVA